MQTAQEIADFTSCNTPQLSGYQLTTMLIRNGKKLGLKSSELLVFMALASYWNGKPVYPRINTLSDNTTLSEKAVRTALNGLLAKGYIIKSKRGKNANVYNINVNMVISTVQTGKSNPSSAVNSTAPCNMKLNHEKLEQQHEVVVFLQKDSKGVKGTANKEVSSTTTLAVSEIQNKYPLCLQRKTDKGEIRDIKRYWGSLRPHAKQEYWEQDKLEAEKLAKRQELKELRAKQAEQERLQAEQEALLPPITETYNRQQALEFCAKFVVFGQGRALKMAMVKEFATKHNITWAEMVECKNLQCRN